jgi:hypothetical protein
MPTLAPRGADRRASAILRVVPVMTLCALLMPSGEAWAKGMVYTPAPASSYGSHGACGGGLIHRLCRPCAGDRYGDTMMIGIGDMFNPCNYPSPGYGGRHGHCFPNCFTGLPCPCCVHTVRCVPRWSLHGILAQWRYKHGECGTDYVKAPASTINCSGPFGCRREVRHAALPPGAEFFCQWGSGPPTIVGGRPPRPDRRDGCGSRDATGGDG